MKNPYGIDPHLSGDERRVIEERIGSIRSGSPGALDTFRESSDREQANLLEGVRRARDEDRRVGLAAVGMMVLALALALATLASGSTPVTRLLEGGAVISGIMALLCWFRARSYHRAFSVMTLYGVRESVAWRIHRNVQSQRGAGAAGA